MVVASHKKSAPGQALGVLGQEERLLEQAIVAGPPRATTLAELGRVRTALGRPAEAMEVLGRAIELDPSLASAHAHLGSALKLLGRLDEAEAAYRRAVDVDYRFAPAHQHLGELLRQRGNLVEAKRSFQQAVMFEPRLRSVRLLLADLLLELGEFPTAVEHYRQAIATGTVTASIYINLGIALKESGDPQGSFDSFERSVRIDPGSAEAQLSFASALLECERLDEALARVRAAIELRPDLAPAHIVHGMILAAQGDWASAARSAACGMGAQETPERISATLCARLMNIGLNDRALEYFKMLIERDPNDVGALHFMASLTGGNPDHPDERYVRQLFDEYADTFEHHLKDALGYSVPRDIAAALLKERSRPTPWDVLDLGCGTGLVGLELVPHARSLVGVDLSPKMIERARLSKAYTQLKVLNLMCALTEESPSGYDVICAGDVFLYVGKLDSLAPAMLKALRPGGMVAFSVEAAEFSLDTHMAQPCGYWLTRSGRYVHTEAYLRGLAVGNDFEIKVLRTVQLRTERRRPVIGWLALWTATLRAT